jgi:uncharacterized membrane protein YedE/YeeE
METNIFMLATGLMLGLAAGFIMHRADFCLAGMFRDFFLFKTVFKLRALLLLIVASMLLFEAAREIGWLPLYPFPVIGPPALTTPLGGFMFGIGMVLAGGCVVGSLYKMGTGNMASAVAIIGMIAGSAIFAEFFPWWQTVAAASTILKDKITLPQLLDSSPLPLVAVTILLTLPYFFKIYRQGAWVRRVYTEGSLQPWKAALLLALIGLISYIAIGMPLGITTSYAKCAAYIEAALFSNHFEGLSFFKATSLKYLHPLTGEQLSGGPGPKLDAIALIQFPLIFGIVFGSTLSATILKEFRIQWNIPARQYFSAAVGGIMMGLASRMGAGCNVWHLLGGLPIMALQSMLFLAGLIPGAWLGARLLDRYIIH